MVIMTECKYVCFQEVNKRTQQGMLMQTSCSLCNLKFHESPDFFIPYKMYGNQWMD